jgi:hypothetical protein
MRFLKSVSHQIADEFGGCIFGVPHFHMRGKLNNIGINPGREFILDAGSGESTRSAAQI